jgi:hypothetical protein
MKRSAEHINEALRGYTEVVKLSLEADRTSGMYELTLSLANSEGHLITLTCHDVSSLRLSDFGGGLTQFLTLRVEDVVAQQLDRIALHFADLERGAIAFDCSAADIVT